MTKTIDWAKLANELGTLSDNGECGSSTSACEAIEKIIGEQNIRDAVDYYIDGGRGSELARYVIWQIHPWSSMEYCYEIYKKDNDLERKISAVELLRVAADKRVIPWITEFLLDSNKQIQGWGIGIVDQLLWSELVEEDEMTELLELAESVGGKHLSDGVDFIRAFLQIRKRNKKIIQDLDDEDKFKRK